MADNDRAEACVFCQIVSGNVEAGIVAYQDEMTAVFPSLHQRPNNRGHMLVVPTTHVSAIYDVDELVGAALMNTVARVARAAKKAFAADGIAIKQHNEKHGGQDVFHVHFHVFPCFDGDGFFRGNKRFPAGFAEVPLQERIDQSTRLRQVISDSSC